LEGLLNRLKHADCLRFCVAECGDGVLLSIRVDERWNCTADIDGRQTGLHFDGARDWESGARRRMPDHFALGEGGLRRREESQQSQHGNVGLRHFVGTLLVTCPMGTQSNGRPTIAAGSGDLSTVYGRDARTSLAVSGSLWRLPKLERM